MTDERTGLSWDYTRKTGVLHTEIVAPSDSPVWVFDRAALWNEAEAREDKTTRPDQAVTGRDWVIALPHEISHAERIALTRQFAQALVDRYGVAVDFAIHAPDKDGDNRNYHAHVLMTARAVTAEGWAKAKYRDLDKRCGGAEEIGRVRELWADLQNRFAETHGYDWRVDHRSFADQGIDKTATVHLGPDASAAERRGEPTDLGDRNRAAANDNAEREALAAELAKVEAEIIDLDDERERRRVAREEREAAREITAEAILQMLTAQRPTFTEADLSRVLSRQISDPYKRRDMAEAIFARPDVVGLAERKGATASRFTTDEVLREEAAALAAGRAMASDRSHAATRTALFGTLEKAEFASMNDEQRAATMRATGPEGLSIISGEAGTGKSYTAQAIRQTYEAEGKRVIGTSYTNAVVQDMKRDGFNEVRTIAGLLIDHENGRAGWDRNTVLMVDEAAMLATKDLARLLTAAQEAGAKVILTGDEAQLSSIMRGGLFPALRDEHGAAVLREVVRVRDADQARAFNQMHEGEFRAALATFESRGRIKWGDTQDEARAGLVSQWAKDTAERPDATRFVFAYTNAEVHALNADLRAIRKERGELGADTRLQTKDGPADFAPGDRVQFTGSAWSRSDRDSGLANGNVGTIRAIEDGRVTVALDGKPGAERVVTFTVGENERGGEFNAMRHGYAGTIYKGQGRTVDDAYSLHSQHWRSASSYVATTRHRDNVTIFTARELAADTDALARQMGRYEERRAASQFEIADKGTDPSKGFGTAAQEATGRPQTADAVPPVSKTGPAEERRPTPAEMAEAQKRAAKVAASRDPAAALHRQHKKDHAAAAKAAGAKPAQPEARKDQEQTTRQSAEDRAKAEALRAMREDRAADKGKDERERLRERQRQRDRGRTR